MRSDHKPNAAGLHWPALVACPAADCAAATAPKWNGNLFACNQYCAAPGLPEKITGLQLAIASGIETALMYFAATNGIYLFCS